MLLRFIGLFFFFLAVLITSSFARPGPNEGQDFTPVEPAEPPATEPVAEPSAAQNVEGEAPPVENTPEEAPPAAEQPGSERVASAEEVPADGSAVAEVPAQEGPAEQPAVAEPAVAEPAEAEPVVAEPAPPAETTPVDKDEKQVEEQQLASEGNAAPKEEFVYKYNDPIEAAYKLFGNSSDANERAHAAWELARRSLAALQAIEEELINGQTQAHIEADITTTNGKSTVDVETGEGDSATTNVGEEVPVEKRTRRKSARRSAKVSIS